MKKHKIQWLNLPGYKGETWNPIIGCSKVSEGCRNCYAEKMARRLSVALGTKGEQPSESWIGYSSVISNGQWNGKTTLIKSALVKPASWKTPRIVFVCSMGDLFHESTSFDAIEAVFSVMADCDQHIYIVLTKRPKRMLEFYNWKSSFGIPWQPKDNVWMGVSAENQAQADIRIPYLKSIYAAVKLVSVEPMLGPVNLVNLNNGATDAFNPADAGINWVICGGESGHNARPMHPDWVRSLRNQCQAAGVPFFFKQWGEWKPMGTTEDLQILPFGQYNTESKFGFIKTGKLKSGNLLDGKKHEEYPSFDSAQDDNKPQICYKTNEICKYDCKGLCRESM